MSFYDEIRKAEEQAAMERMRILGCGCLLLILNLIFGGVSVNYLLLTFTDKVLPFMWATVVGLITGSFVIPAAVVVWILKTFGIL